MERRLSVAGGPHWRGGGGLLLEHAIWTLALLPAAVVGVALWGWPAARVLGLCLFFMLAVDASVARCVPSRDRPANAHALPLALLLAFLFPVGAPWWLVLVGCLLVIAVGKRLFGGVGGYPVHPVLLGYAMLQLSWPQRLDYTAAAVRSDLAPTMIEPLRLVRSVGAAAQDQYGWTDLLLGRQVGGVGNAMVLALLVGGLLLVILRRVDWRVPLGFLVGVASLALLLHAMDPARFVPPLFHLLAGSTVFGAFFLAPEPTTSPVHPRPLLLYGLLAGLLLTLLRSFSVWTDGAVFAVLLANLCNPLLDRWAPPVRGREVGSLA